ncbi:MAG: NAD-dependent epimerase/dehydratase family protein [Calditrichia bacterium]
MNVLITGGTGFIGSRLALRSLERGDSVSVLGQKNNPAEAENIKFLEKKGVKVFLKEITDREALAEILKEIDVVYHLAAAQHEMNIPDERFWEVNVEGTKNLLELCANANVKRFVHGSTIGVYGILDGEIDESSPCNPDNIYGVTKLEGEKVALSFSERVPVVVIRIPETYGPGDRRLLKLFKAIQKGVFFMIGSGRNLHHLIYVDDLIDGFFLAAQSEKAVGDVLLLAGEKAITTNEMVGIIADELGAKIPGLRAPLSLLWGVATIMEKTLRPLGIQPPLHRRRMDFFRKSFYYSLVKAKDILNYSPQVSFKEGVAKTAKWYKSMGYL